jgi:glycosyltransferase involved in cell wall biosynthesis
MLCLEVVEGLAKKGHAIAVLTSVHGVDHQSVDGHVHRLLALESNLNFYDIKEAWLYPLRKRHNLQHLRRLIHTEQPDVVFVWGMWNLSKDLAQEVERLMNSRVVYYLANPWPIEPNMHQRYWDSPAQTSWGRLIKPLLRIPARLLLRAEWEPLGLRFEHAPCCSEAQREQLLQAGVPLQDAPVIYEGIDLRPYLAQTGQRWHRTGNGTLSLVFVGILAKHKGVHTTIEALTHLSAADRGQVHLTILGSGHPQYESLLRDLVTKHQLSDFVSFHDPIPRSDLPAFLGRFDVLLLPSIWAEPLARIMQEGLASGMVVIGSATGGTAETISHGENGLLFPAGDAPALAKQIAGLLSHPASRYALAEAGRRTAVEKFELDRMVNDIEDYLEQINTAAFGVPAERDKPLVSVIIPNFNHGRFIGDAIRSVLKQDYRNFEIIVVDDGSTDNSREVVAQFSEQVHYIRQENQGLSAARNTGIRAAKGAYIGLLDADDMYEPDFLSTLMSALQLDPTAHGVHCGYQFVDQSNHPLPQTEARSVPHREFFGALLDGDFLVPEAMLVRRSCYQSVGPFDETLSACEDWDMWLRISRRFKIIGTTQVLTRHRVLPGSMSTDPVRMLTTRLAVLKKQFGSEPTDEEGNGKKRRAYGRAYLGSCVEFLQCGHNDPAYESFEKMARICPDLLTELDTFYQLGCGNQPKGSMGHFASLDLQQNAQMLLNMLGRLFAEPETKIRLGRFRRRAYGQAYFALGLLSYGSRQLGNARRFLWCALTTDPQWGLKLRFMLTWAKSLLNSRWIDRFSFRRKNQKRFAW